MKETYYARQIYSTFFLSFDSDIWGLFIKSKTKNYIYLFIKTQITWSVNELVIPLSRVTRNGSRRL